MIKMLGAFGGKGENKSTTSIQVSDTIVIDAGNILNGLNEEAKYINHILISHSHLDHITDVPFLIDKYFEYRLQPLKIYALKETIKALKEHIFNFSIWPDFSMIKLLDGKNFAIEFIEIEPNKDFVIEDISFKPILSNHTVPCIGFVINKPNYDSIYFTSDTYSCDNIWNELNNNLDIKSLIIDVSFPSRLDELCNASKHLSPKLLKQELIKLKRDDVKIYINHLKPNFMNEVSSELIGLNIIKNDTFLLKDGDILK